MRRVRTVALTLLLGAGGCFADRERPGGPTGPGPEPSLGARVLIPETGSTILTGVDIIVRVEGRDLNGTNLNGVGFVARRLTGFVTVDSAAVFFPLRSDSTHQFTFRVPDTFVTNTQVDVQGIAYGPAGQTGTSVPVHLVVVQAGQRGIW